MIVDADSFAAGHVLRTPVCIVGSGPAGLAIALELERAGIDCCVLESGGHALEARVSELSDGGSVGRDYRFGEGTRSRFLGGSSNCWGGFCRPWDDSAFDARPWVEGSGWPIGRSELMPFYRRAHDFLGLRRFEYGLAPWMSDAPRALDRRGRAWSSRHAAIQALPLDPARVEQIITQLSGPIRLGPVHAAGLAASRHITTCLHANVTEVIATDDGASVRSMRVRTLKGREWTVQADRFVLCAGGIENARILLASDRQQPAGLGNAHDLVGRYFQDHPRVMSGRIELAPEYRRNPLFDIKYHIIADDILVDGQRICGQFRLPLAVQRDEGLLDAQVWFRSLYAGERTELPRALLRMRQRTHRQRSAFKGLWADLQPVAAHPVRAGAFIAAHLTGARPLVRSMSFETIVECNPDPQSRVTIDRSRRDALGMPRAVIDWRLSGQTVRTVDRTVERIAAEFERSGVGRVTLSAPVGQTGWDAGMDGTYHHMGTTRMADSPRQGVVDRHCRVHGLANLFVAGSSVFPTSSSNHPTMTLVALAMRLADRLVQLQHGAPHVDGSGEAPVAGRIVAAESQCAATAG